MILLITFIKRKILQISVIHCMLNIHVTYFSKLSKLINTESETVHSNLPFVKDKISTYMCYVYETFDQFTTNLYRVYMYLVCIEDIVPSQNKDGKLYTYMYSSDFK